MPRLRDLGITIGNLPPGPHNAITDVSGFPSATPLSSPTSRASCEPVLQWWCRAAGMNGAITFSAVRTRLTATVR